MASDSARDRPVTLVDSNVILDIVTGDARWAGWSEERLARVADEGEVVINPIVYAEVSVGFDRIEDLDAALPKTAFKREPLPYAAGFLAGKASSPIGATEAPDRRRSPTSTSARTLPSLAIAC